MEKILSKLARKPTGLTEQKLKTAGWYDAREKIFNHLEEDGQLKKLINEFEFIDNKLRLEKSARNMTINFHTLENASGRRYVYARTQFVIDGKRKDFRKYLGKDGEVDTEKIDLFYLKKYFLDVLKNYLEY